MNKKESICDCGCIGAKPGAKPGINKSAKSLKATGAKVAKNKNNKTAK